MSLFDFILVVFVSVYISSLIFVKEGAPTGYETRIRCDEFYKTCEMVLEKKK